MESDRFQMINTLFHAMIDGIIIQLFWFSMNCRFFFINIAVGFRLFVIHRRSQRDTFLRRPCIRPSTPSVRPHFCPSGTISQYLFVIRIILCTNDMYHVLSISYKFRQNLSYGPCFSNGIYNAKPISAILYDDLHISPELLYLTTSHYRP